MFKIGVSFGRSDLNVEGHLQMGYNSKTIKNYTPIQSVSSDVNTSLELATEQVPDQTSEISL